MNKQEMKNIISKNIREIIRNENDPDIVDKLIFSNLEILNKPNQGLFLREIFKKGMINIGKKMVDIGFNIQDTQNPLYEFDNLDEDTCIYLVNKGADTNITVGKKKYTGSNRYRYEAHLIMHAGAKGFEKLFNLIAEKNKITFRFHNDDIDKTCFEQDKKKGSYLSGHVWVNGKFYDPDCYSFTG